MVDHEVLVLYLLMVHPDVELSLHALFFFTFFTMTRVEDASNRIDAV
jgi:hypothetical protein